MIQFIIHDIVRMTKEYILYAIVIGSVVTAGVGIVQSIRYKVSIGKIIGSNRLRYVLLNVLLIHFFIVVSITYLSREPGSRVGVNLKLFGTYSQYNILENRYFIENILLFIPFGILLPLLSSKFYEAIRCLGTGMLLSIIIEISQYLTKRGYFQIDDIITNIAGTLIGFVLVYAGRVLLRNPNGISKLK